MIYNEDKNGCIDVLYTELFIRLHDNIQDLNIFIQWFPTFVIHMTKVIKKFIKSGGGIIDTSSNGYRKQLSIKSKPATIFLSNH